jgi:hypothetical protein
MPRATAGAANASRLKTAKWVQMRLEILVSRPETGSVRWIGQCQHRITYRCFGD